MYNPTNQRVTFSGFYTPGQILVRESKDIHGNVSRTVHNRLGQLIAACQLINAATSTWAITYNVYDDFGRLVRTYQPEAFSKLATTYDETSTFFTNEILPHTFFYVYDAESRLISKRQPGKSWESVVYYPSGMVALTQNVQQQFVNQYTYYTYDKLGRMAHSGFMGVSRTPAQMQARVDSSRGNEAVTRIAPPNGNYPHDAYTSPAWFASIGSLDSSRSQTFYDDYDFKRNGTSYHVKDTSSAMMRIAPGAQTGTLTTSQIQTEAPSYLRSVTHYDRFGRVVYEMENIHGQPDSAWVYKTFEYDFVGRVTKETIGSNMRTSTYYEYEDQAKDPRPVNFNPFPPRTVTYHYNAEGRLYQVKDASGGILKRLRYNVLGQLVEENIAGGVAPINAPHPGLTTFAQSVDYRYHALGMLRAINNVGSLTEQGSGANSADLFHLEMGFESEGPDLASGFPASQRRRYDGRASWVRWQEAGGVAQLRSYRYDGAGRLLEVYSGEQTYAAGSFGAPTAKGRYAEQMSYDRNGNILTTTRRQFNAAQGRTLVIDSLLNTYSGNRLTNAHDRGLAADTIPGINNVFSFNQSAAAANPLAVEFSYDAMGAITSDLNRSASVTYTPEGRVARIQRGTVVQDYAYDGFGRKTYERITVGTQQERRAFVMGAEVEYQQFNGQWMASYATYNLGGASVRLASEQTGSPWSAPQVAWTYFIVDQQGSPRVIFQVNGAGQAVVMERNHYYSSGLRIAELSGSPAGEERPEGYAEGRRIARELNLVWQEHGVRHYDPTLGRFNQYEPLADRFAHQTPYSYADNDPINGMDPTGLYNAWNDKMYRLRGQFMGDDESFYRMLSRGRNGAGGGFGHRWSPEEWNRMTWWERDAVNGDAGKMEFYTHMALDHIHARSTGFRSPKEGSGSVLADRIAKWIQKNASFGRWEDTDETTTTTTVTKFRVDNVLYVFFETQTEVTEITRWVGYSILLLLDYEGALYAGHVAVGFMDEKGKVRLYSRNGPSVKVDNGEVSLSLADLSAKGYDLAYKIRVPDSRDYEYIQNYAENHVGTSDDYVLMLADCNSFFGNVVSVAGKKDALPWPNGALGVFPTLRYGAVIRANPGGYFIDIK